jgi:hypothetical protein
MSRNFCILAVTLAFFALLAARIPVYRAAG